MFIMSCCSKRFDMELEVERKIVHHGDSPSMAAAIKSLLDLLISILISTLTLIVESQNPVDILVVI